MIFFTRLMCHWLRKKFALGVFLDVEGAFDNTYFESADDAASNHGVCSTINRSIDFMLRSRSVFVDICATFHKKEDFGGFFRPNTL
jgi:hypothetical protein